MVIKIIVFIDDISNFQAVNEIYNPYFTDDFPARICEQVAKLSLDTKVEIEGRAQI
jgi:2-iminobutanoate/2-iminopropanoate deaminase